MLPHLQLKNMLAVRRLLSLVVTACGRAERPSVDRGGAGLALVHGDRGGLVAEHDTRDLSVWQPRPRPRPHLLCHPPPAPRARAGNAVHSS